MAVLEVWKKRVKGIPLLARPLRACRQGLRTLTAPVPTRIEARRGIPKLQLGELWQCRELMLTMAVRDFQIRYKQTILGALWAIVPSLMTGLVFAMTLGQVAELRSKNLPYAAFFFAAIVPWNFFVYIFNHSALSLTSNLNMLQKVYFPRLILPFKTVLVASIDFCIASSLIVAVILYYWRIPSLNVLWLPVFILLALLAGLGIGLWFAALNVYFRDIGNFLPICTQLWFFLTPIIYPITLLREPWQTIMRLNPMTSVVMGFRWALFDDGPPPDAMLVLVFLLTSLFFIGGMYFFRKVERTIADVV
jgi:lipopolysaccharide transport system permease protein